MKHLMSCPRSLLGADDKPCTCGAGIPVVTPGGARALGHADSCPCSTTPCQPPCRDCACSAAQEAGSPPPRSPYDSPYTDVDYARALIKRAEEIAPENSDLARFLLDLATETRLLAELQGKWEF